MIIYLDRCQATVLAVRLTCGSSVGKNLQRQKPSSANFLETGRSDFPCGFKTCPSILPNISSQLSVPKPLRCPFMLASQWDFPPWIVTIFNMVGSIRPISINRVFKHCSIEDKWIFYLHLRRKFQTVAFPLDSVDDLFLGHRPVLLHGGSAVVTMGFNRFQYIIWGYPPWLIFYPLRLSTWQCAQRKIYTM